MDEILIKVTYSQTNLRKGKIFCENCALGILFISVRKQTLLETSLVGKNILLYQKHKSAMNERGSTHCVKSVQIRSCSGPYLPVFELKLLHKSPYSVRIQETKEQKKLLIWTPFMQCTRPFTLIALSVSNRCTLQKRRTWICRLF